MQVGVILQENLEVFRTLLLPEAADALAAGEPLTALAVTEERLAIGAMAGYLEDGIFQIVSLYVSPDYRRRGAGRMMLEALTRVLFRERTGMIIRFTVTREEHEDLCAFLDALGFKDETESEGNIYLISAAELKETPFFSKSRSAGTTRSFKELSDLKLRTAEREARESGIPLPEGGLCGGEIEKEASAALVKDGEIRAYVAFDRSCMGKLTLAAAWAANGEPMALPMLLRESFARVREFARPDDEIAIQAVNSSSTALIRALIPGARLLSRTYIRNWLPTDGAAEEEMTLEEMVREGTALEELAAEEAAVKETAAEEAAVKEAAAKETDREN